MILTQLIIFDMGERGLINPMSCHHILQFKSNSNNLITTKMKNSDIHANYVVDQEEQEQCPECGNPYTSSESQQSSDNSSSQQRILIPIHKNLLQQNNEQEGLEAVLKNLQKEIEVLKAQNHEKDRMIEEMKRQIDHKMTHYSLYNEINRQNEEINRLRGEMQYTNNFNKQSRNHDDSDEPLTHKKHDAKAEYGIQKRENKNNKRVKQAYESNQSFGNDFNLKSTYNIASEPKYDFKMRKSLSHRNTIPQNFSFHSKVNAERSDFLEGNPSAKPKYVFKISEAKKKIEQLQQIVKVYKEEAIWLKNFANTFIKTMQQISDKRYNEKIFLKQWNLKKKVKSSWRYLKHLLAFLYAE